MVKYCKWRHRNNYLKRIFRGAFSFAYGFELQFVRFAIRWSTSSSVWSAVTRTLFAACDVTSGHRRPTNRLSIATIWRFRFALSLYFPPWKCAKAAFLVASPSRNFFAGLKFDLKRISVRFMKILVFINMKCAGFFNQYHSIKLVYKMPQRLKAITVE